MLTIKSASLTLLCIWMTLLTVVMHISQTERPAGVPPYKPASAVILAELGKLICSLLLAYRECKKALKQERQRASLYPSGNPALLFDADQDGTFLSRSNSQQQLQQSQQQPRRESSVTHMSEEEPAEKEGLLPPANINPAATSLPMSRQTSSQSSWSSGKSDLSSSISGGGVHRRENSNEEYQKHSLDYPGSPSERIRSDFVNQEITSKEVIQRMKEDTFGPDWMKLSIPAFLFTGQSNLSYYASSNLSVPVFQITYQLKIPATALCSVLMLKRALSRLQWASIVILSLGVGIVQLASSSADKVYHAHSVDDHGKAAILHGPGLNNGTSNPLLGARSVAESAATEHVEMNQMLGLLAVVLACLSSGFSGVFFERQLKKAPAAVPPSSPATPNLSNNQSNQTASTQQQQPRKTGLWIRNIQLSMFSLLVGSTIYALTSPSDIPDFLVGFTPIAWFVVFVQIVGGLLAAVVIQYADNIAKTFSASCSIILSFAVSIAFFDFKLSPGVVLGSTAVMFATWLFNASGTKPSAAAASASFLPTSSQNGSPASAKDYVRLPTTPSTKGSPNQNTPGSESRRPSVFPWVGTR